ncbi:MAG TPA: hypothetical protein VJB87_01320 [Candidatus Nanoarchaeia archaeon]|nr:hypothetical protein [Candidatus Nanoarchaeia archaeon]
MNPFKTIDNYVMEGVGVVNYFWNKTTGRTPVGLAQTCFSISILSHTANGLNETPPDYFNGALNMFSLGVVLGIIEVLPSLKKKDFGILPGIITTYFGFLGYFAAAAAIKEIISPNNQDAHEIAWHTPRILSLSIESLGAFTAATLGNRPRKTRFEQDVEKLQQLVADYQERIRPEPAIRTTN